MAYELSLVRLTRGNRAPLASDDASRGQTIGARWLYETQEYICISNTIDDAVWMLAGGGSVIDGIDDVPGLADALNGKQPLVDGIGDIPGLLDALAGKQAQSAVLSSIAALVGSGGLRRTAAGVWELNPDAASIWTGNQIAFNALPVNNDPHTIYVVTDGVAIAGLPVGGYTDYVLTKGSGADYDVKWASLSTLRRPAYNYLTNGNFDIWQRGVSFSTTGVYTADRWYWTANISAGSIAQDTVNTKYGKYALKMTMTTKGGSFTDNALIQPLESIDCLKFQDKTMTFSVRIKRNSSFNAGSFRIAVYTGTGTDERTVGTGRTEFGVTIPYSLISTTTFDVFSVTFVVPSNATQIAVLARWQSAYGGASAPDGSVVWLQACQLTMSSDYVECDVRPYEEEFRKCRRYCKVYSEANTLICYGSSYSATAAQMQISFGDCPLRAIPTLTFSNITDFRVTLSNVASLAVASVLSSSATPTTAVFNLSHSSNVSFGSNKIVDCGILGSGGKLVIDAEL